MNLQINARINKLTDENKGKEELKIWSNMVTKYEIK